MEIHKFSEDRDKAVNLLADNLPWSPLDYIPGISIPGDRKLFFDTFSGKIEEENDLRYIYTLDNGEKWIIFAERLPWDSEFFGFGVGKISGVFPLMPPLFQPYADISTCAAHLLDVAKEKKIAYLFAPVDARDLMTLRNLGTMGFSLIETRVYYHREISNYQYKERYPVRFATFEDVEILGKTASSMVNLYDRFHSDPFISINDANRLMVEWINASITKNFADVTVVPDSPSPKAFCTAKYHQVNWKNWELKVGQPVFSAVAPEFKGWYRKLISEISYHFKDIGIEHAFLSTQVTNKPVIWVWESLGYKFGRCEHIFRKAL